MNTNLILISIKGCNYELIKNTLIKNKINYTDLNIREKDITLKINEKDFNKLKSELTSVTIIRKLGFNGFKEFIKKHYIILLSFLFTYIILLILSNVIFDIEIITTNTELKRIITLYLNDYNIKKYKFMKSNKELEMIKEKILEENKKTLEWIEIERNGTSYIINLTERVINETKKENTKTDIVAKKDALIKYIVAKSGTKIKEVNEIVKKGETIITGNILKNEEIVDTIRASGEVYGEVWYTVSSIVPYTHTEYENTGETINHIYIDLFGKKITLMGKYETNNSMNDTKVLIDKPYLFFRVMKEEKKLYKYVTHNLSTEEAYKEAIKRADKSINARLNNDEYIIDKKVLKNNTYSSKIELEIFYRVYERIDEEKEIVTTEPEGE